MAIGLWAQIASPHIAEAFTVTRVYALTTQSPLPEHHESEPLQSKEAPAPDLEQAPQSTGDGVDDFLRRVHILESSQGTNTTPGALHNHCKSLGLSNELGWGGMQMMYCFPSHEAAVERVRRWYFEHREYMTEAETYCYYNEGVRREDCPYWLKAQNL